MPDIFETTAAQYDDAAGELEAAARHLRIAADHLRGREVPRCCAHAWAAEGHQRNARRQLDELASLHAAKATFDVG
jgi:hypothetical protein